MTIETTELLIVIDHRLSLSFTYYQSADDIVMKMHINVEKSGEQYCHTELPQHYGRWVGEPKTAAGGTKGEKADFKGNGGEGGTCGGELVAATAEARTCETSSPDNIISIVCKTSPR
uniref:Uncharacterized protein n=1 Tax=Glossina pallidipes TaxID=7398 RepID=A0A1B0AGJ7_GLOPL